MNIQSFRDMAMASRGQKKAELVLKNAKVLNVFTEEILDADIAVVQDTIVGVGQYQGEREIDLKGKLVTPGFMDSHLHLESTLVTPRQLIEQAAQCGTTTFIVDPHESANVSGADGIDFILNETENTPANVYVMMPSCVPATSIDDNGCAFGADDMRKYLTHERILGLGEVMDCVSVVNADPKMYDKLSLFSEKNIDGHAPLLNDYELNTYCLARIQTDHECVDYEYAMKERRNGMQILIREGSAAKNLTAIVKGIVANKVNTDGFSFCTDDKHIEDIHKEGHINHNVKMAIELGIDPVKAIKMATINTAKCYQLKHLGAVAPGYQADFVIFDSLDNLNILDVYYKGQSIDCTTKNVSCKKEIPANLMNTVHIQEVTKQTLNIPNEGEKVHVIGMLEGQITTQDCYETVPNCGGLFQANEDYSEITVIERHHATGMVGCGIVKGFHIHGGAIASSVSHDSHNIIAIGDNEEDIILAINEINRLQGGYVLLKNRQIYESLPLPIMGLISNDDYHEVDRRLKRMIEEAHRMGVPSKMDPFITLSFMALPVIPQLRITPRGVYNVEKHEFLK